MADPTAINIPAKTWTPVLTNKLLATIYLQRKIAFSNRVYTAWVDTGGTAPTLAPGTSGSTAIELETRTLPVNRTAAADVYLWSQREINVTVDTE